MSSFTVQDCILWRNIGSVLERPASKCSSSPSAGFRTKLRRPGSSSRTSRRRRPAPAPPVRLMKTRSTMMMKMMIKLRNLRC